MQTERTTEQLRIYGDIDSTNGKPIESTTITVTKQDQVGPSGTILSQLNNFDISGDRRPGGKRS